MGCDAIYRGVQFDCDTLKMAATGSFCLYTNRIVVVFQKSRTFFNTALRKFNLSQKRKGLLSFRNSVSLYALRIIALKLRNSVPAHWQVKRNFTYLVQLLLAMKIRWMAGKTKSVMCDVTYLVNGVDNELILLGCYSVSSGTYLPTFRMNLTHPSSVQEERNFVRRLDPENEGT